MEKISTLFRKEVLQSQQQFMPVLLQHPIRQEMMIMIIGIIFACMSLWFLFSAYSEKIQVRGFIDLQPQTEVLYPSGKSIIIKQYVKTGQRVFKGDLLMELLAIRHKTSYNIYASMDGQVAEIGAVAGQWVQDHQPLVRLLPQDFHWIGWLFIPIPFARLIQQGQHVVVHYDAYPYQRYGSTVGTIQLYSPLMVHQPTHQLPIPMHDPFYKVSMLFHSPYLFYQTHVLPIYKGMTFTAIWYGEKKSMWQILKERYIDVAA